MARSSSRSSTSEEATLKRLRRKGDRIALEAANPRFETRIYRPDQIHVQGRLIGLWRRYKRYAWGDSIVIACRLSARARVP